MEQAEVDIAEYLLNHFDATTVKRSDLPQEFRCFEPLFESYVCGCVKRFLIEAEFNIEYINLTIDPDYVKLVLPGVFL